MRNRFVLAAAGSRKTTFIVEESLRYADNKILLLTYTIDNFKQICEYIVGRNGSIPTNLKVCSWYSFLLTDAARPYQNFLYDKDRISSIYFTEGRSAHFVPKSDVARYYMSSDRRIYTDKIAEFACVCNEKSNGFVIGRLENLYDQIFIDEVQDLAGYDLDFLRLLLQSKISVTVVGDSRQATYFTNCSPKNRKFKGRNIGNLFKHWEQCGLVEITERNECYRCNQIICDLSDKLYPDMTTTISRNDERTGHDGVFKVCEQGLKYYIDTYNPKILRDSRKTDTKNLPALNFGLSKGQTFERVLIFPNGPIKAYLRDRDASRLKDKTKANFYVGLTRAKHSVVFFDDGDMCFRDLPHCGRCLDR
jgi:DNA helicase II / ATP-dependent DNA helicase PcrA